MAEAITNPSNATPIVYEDRLRISRAKFDSLFGWKQQPVVDQQMQQQQQQQQQSVDGNENSKAMPSCICEIMRENQVTVVPNFQRNASNDDEIIDGDDEQSLLAKSNNKRDYVLRIFGENESNVASAKFKIQSAVHQVAVMGQQSHSQPSCFDESSSRPSSIIGSTSVPNASTDSSSNGNKQWWSNVSDRVTLRVDVDYSVHSHLIGRNGGNIASVMRATQTHIHFPDSNKQSQRHNANYSGSRSASPSLINGFSNNAPIKNNYVTVSGANIEQVEEARQYIRRMTPLRLAIPFASLHVPLSLAGQAFVPARLAAASRRIMQEYCDRGLAATMRSDSLVVSGTMSIADLVVQATQQICLEVYECLIPVSLSVDVTPRDLAFVRGPGDCYIRKIEHSSGCQFLFPNGILEDTRSVDGRRQPIRIVGFPANAVKARLLLQSRLPIQLSWPLRSQTASIETDAALKETVATKYEIFLSVRDRNANSNGSRNNYQQIQSGHDSGSATPDLLNVSKNRTAGNAAAAYQMVQPKHVVLKSFEGNLPNVYRFFLYAREAGQKAGQNSLDDPSPQLWTPVPADYSDDEMFQKVDALVHDSFPLSQRFPTPTGINLVNGTSGDNNQQILYASYALAMAQQQQQQSAFLNAMASGWSPAMYSSRSHSSMATCQSSSNSRAILAQRNIDSTHESGSPRSVGSPDSNSTGSLENCHIVIDEKSIANSFKQTSTNGLNGFQQRSASSMSFLHRDSIPEGRPITAASRILSQRTSFDSTQTSSEADRVLEQFAASLSRAGTSMSEADRHRVVISAESHKVLEIPRRPASSVDKPSSSTDPISSGIINSVMAASDSDLQPTAPVNKHLRIPTNVHCGLLFSLSQPGGQFLQNEQQEQNSHSNNHDVINKFGMSVAAHQGPFPSRMLSHQPQVTTPSDSIGAEFMRSSASRQPRNLSITGGFASKLQSTELYYEQFADRIDARLGALLTKHDIERSDMGKLASHEINFDTFTAMSESDLRDCGIWQLGVRRQLMRVIVEAKKQQSEVANENNQSAPIQPQQLPPQSPPFFASLKTYKMEPEFRLL